MLVIRNASSGRPGPLGPRHRLRVEAKEPLPLEPGVRVEHPVRRPQTVIGDHEHGWILVVEERSRVDQSCARGIDGLIHADELISFIPAAVRGMLVVVAMP